MYECTISGYRSCENGFPYTIRSQTMFESVQEHLEDLRHVKRGRTCVSSMNALFQGTEVVKMVSPTPLDPKRCLRVFWSIWKTFGTLNKEELVFHALMHYIRVPNLQHRFCKKVIHSTTISHKIFLSV